MDELESKIANIPEGKTFGVIGESRSYFVRRAGGDFQVEAAWVVLEAYDDDHDSYTYHPFKYKSGQPRSAVPWVGRRLTVKTVAEAAAAYDEFKTLMASNSLPNRGEVIGSVSR